MITVRWSDPEETIIELDYSDPIESWDEYQEAVKRSYTMAQAKGGLVYIIHRPGRAVMPPGNALLQVRKALDTVPKNVGLVFTIVDNLFAKMVVETISRIAFAYKLRFVKSMDEAQELITKHLAQTQSIQV